MKLLPALTRKVKKEIWDTISRLAHTRTLIIISHRMSSVRSAHCIYVLKDGQVAQQGDHEALMAQDGLYRQLVLRQQNNGGDRMKGKFSYSMKEMNRRLLAIGRPIRKYIAISTIASVLGALSHMGLMGFGLYGS